MSTSIYQAIANAMADVSPIAKAKKNQTQGFSYRGIDDIMNELNPILAKHKLFIYPEVVGMERSERQTSKGSSLLYSVLTVKYHFAAEDGSEICATVVGEGMDSGDKSANKALAAAFKYACLQLFCIPTADMPDPDQAASPPSKPAQKTPPPAEMQTRRKALVDGISTILLSKNTDGKNCFTDGERAQAKSFIQNTGCHEQGIRLLEEKRASLAAELEKRRQRTPDADAHNAGEPGIF